MRTTNKEVNKVIRFARKIGLSDATACEVKSSTRPPSHKRSTNNQRRSKMKFYKTKLQTGADSWRTMWAVSAADASKQRTQLKSEAALDPSTGKMAKPETTEHDIPTDKQGLLVWLNANVG